jgi:hypothetical protein
MSLPSMRAGRAATMGAAPHPDGPTGRLRGRARHRCREAAAHRLIGDPSPWRRSTGGTTLASRQAAGRRRHLSAGSGALLWRQPTDARSRVRNPDQQELQ